MEIGNIVNVKSSEGGYWKGKIIEISDKWEHKCENGEVLSHNYLRPIITVERSIPPSHAVFHEDDLIYKDGEYWEI